MPEILKKSNGEIDYTKIFGALAVALVMILQQWQSYRIAEIHAQGQVNKEKFISLGQMHTNLSDIDRRLKILEAARHTHENR